MRICLRIWDGFGAIQFVIAWAAIAKNGSMVINSESFWDREIFRPRNSHKEYTSVYDDSTRTIFEKSNPLGNTID